MFFTFFQLVKQLKFFQGHFEPKLIEDFNEMVECLQESILRQISILVLGPEVPFLRLAENVQVSLNSFEYFVFLNVS